MYTVEIWKTNICNNWTLRVEFTMVILENCDIHEKSTEKLTSAACYVPVTVQDNYT